MTDEEVICTWMDWSLSSWPPDLDALHEVEARLTELQWQAYGCSLVGARESGCDMSCLSDCMPAIAI